MNSSLSAIRNVVLGLVLATALTAGATATLAQTSTSTNSPPKHHHKALAAATGANANAVQALDKAYGILAPLDHDYKGHRARAMHKIEEAAKALGSTLHGGGKGGESQQESDAAVHQARVLLEQALPGLTGMPRHHAAEAIHQLHMALEVK